MAKGNLPQYVSAKELAAIFGVCTEHIYRLHKRGLLPGVRLGRALRGGAWGSTPWGCRSAGRHGGHPDFRGFVIGFRVVVEAPPRTP